MVAAGPRFLVTQLPRVTQAISTLGAAPVPLALGPVYALQLAISYINLAIPSAAGRIAVNVRFFQRHGVPAGGAIAAGAMDGACGFIVQAVLLGLLLVSSVSLDLDLGSAVDSAGQLLLIVVIIAGIAIGSGGGRLAAGADGSRSGRGGSGPTRRRYPQPLRAPGRPAVRWQPRTEILSPSPSAPSRGSAIPSGSGSCCSSTSASGSCRA